MILNEPARVCDWVSVILVVCEWRSELLSSWVSKRLSEWVVLSESVNDRSACVCESLHQCVSDSLCETQCPHTYIFKNLRVCCIVVSLIWLHDRWLNHWLTKQTIYSYCMLMIHEWQTESHDYTCIMHILYNSYIEIMCTIMLWYTHHNHAYKCIRIYCNTNKHTKLLQYM